MARGRALSGIFGEMLDPLLKTVKRTDGGVPPVRPRTRVPDGPTPRPRPDAPPARTPGGAGGRTPGGAGGRTPGGAGGRTPGGSGGNTPGSGGNTPGSDGGTPPARSPRTPSARERNMGRTPGRTSRTGREVQDRMRRDGLLRENPVTGKTEIKDPYGNGWVDMADTDMGHITDAVDYWNNTGKYFGPKSPEVRDWMLDSSNYQLEYAYGPTGNRSRGARSGATYDPPVGPL